MKVLVAGAGGQLGLDFCDLLHEQGVDFVAVDRPQLDIRQPETVVARVRQVSPDWIVNCAAYTAVDKAEEEQEQAFLVNRDAARVLAETACAVNAHILQLSTDFVFSGKQRTPYTEFDAVGPLSIYGQSKQEGEQAVLAACSNSLVLRTSWLYGARGQNFVKTVLRLARERDELRVVDDQIGTPTWTRDLAMAMWQLMEQQQSGIFHFSNAGQASWYEFACAIIEEAKALGFQLKLKQIVPIPTSGYPLPATRPAYSVLSKNKIQALLPQPIPEWRQSLHQMLKELKQCPEC